MSMRIAEIQRVHRKTGGGEVEIENLDGYTPLCSNESRFQGTAFSNRITSSLMQVSTEF